MEKSPCGAALAVAAAVVSVTVAAVASVTVAAVASVTVAAVVSVTVFAVASVTVAAVAVAVFVVPFAAAGVMLAIPTQGILYRYSLESP